MNIEQLNNIIRANMFTVGHKGRWGIPMILWGGIGIGKSSIIESAAEACGLGFNSTIGSICEPPDIAGLQMPSEDRTRVVALAAPWVHKVNTYGRAIQLFDEGTSCSPPVQAAMMQVLLTGQAGDVEVDKGVRFMMAANPVDVAANANDLEMPLANRMGHIHVTPPSTSEWADWLVSGSEEVKEPLHAKLVEERVQKEWGAAFAQAKGLVASFIRRRDQLLHQQPDPGNPQASLAWGSPRTWEYATRALASSAIHKLSLAEQQAFVASFIGPGAYTELLAYQKEADLPDIEKLLDGEVKFEHDTYRVDRTYAVLESCGALLVRNEEGTDQELRRKRALAYWKICGEVYDSDADVILPSGKNVARAKIDMGDGEDRAAYNAVMVKMAPLLDRLYKGGYCG